MRDIERDVRVHLTWDNEADAVYIAFTDIGAGAAIHQRVIANPVKGVGEVILDFNAAGHLLGVELLGSKQLTAELWAP